MIKEPPHIPAPGTRSGKARHNYTLSICVRNGGNQHQINPKESSSRVAVVTGGNKGIGLEICRQLESHGVMVLLTARDEGRGIEAVEVLKKSGVTNVVVHHLDVTVPSSIVSLANFIKTHLGKLDILINNAGISGAIIDHQAFASSIKEQGRAASYLNAISDNYETAEECLNTNYYGVKRVTEALIPFLQLAQSPRIVNISSFFGKLRYIPSEIIRKEMGDVEGLTEERLDQLLRSFLNDFKEEKLEINGWPTSPSAYKVSKVAVSSPTCASAYKVSKVAASSYTRILAKRYPTFCINCVTLGFVKIDKYEYWNPDS